MQRFMLGVAFLALAAASVSCGSDSDLAPLQTGTGRQPSVELNPEYSVHADNAQLELQGASDALTLIASGLSDTKALYGKLFYDPAVQHYVGSAQLDGELLFVAFDNPGMGYVEFGAVVPNWDVQPGIDGRIELAQFQILPGAAQIERVSSKAPGTVPEDAITLAGSIDAANVPTLNWRESLTGDCDNNGEVNISDFTAFGIHYRKTPDPTAPADSEVRDCDFNRDGEVAITDIQKMGQNLNTTLEGYFVRSGPTPTNLSDFAQVERSTLFPAPRRQDGELHWQWTGPALTANTYFQVEPYDRSNVNRGTPSNNDVLLQPTLTVNYTDVRLGFVGQDTWPANRIAPNGDYIVIVTENSADDIAGNSEPFAPEFLQLVVEGEPENTPGSFVDITSSAYLGLAEGGGLATVSLASSTRGRLSFKDRGRITVQTFVPGDFTISQTISFRLMTIDSLALTSASGNSPVNIGASANLQFTVTGTFDFDTDNTNGNEVSEVLTTYCNWGFTPEAGNGGSFAIRSDIGLLQTTSAVSGDSLSLFAEFPNTDDVRLYDNRKRSSGEFVVNIN